MGRVLHVLSQRPSLTGSGVTLEALVRLAGAAGWEQRAVVGVPAEDPFPPVGGLSPDRIHPLVFGTGRLDFPLPGMSDVMPYPSSRFSSLDERRLRAYREAWSAHLASLLERFRPHVIHVHHLWILASTIKDLAPRIPVVNQCHATGFRQMALCPRLAGSVRRGCARNERFAVLHEGHAEELVRTLGVERERVRIVGAGFRDDLFRVGGRREETAAGALLYVGKYSAAKGLPWLLEAFERLERVRPGLVLHVAGTGAGAEAEALRERMVGLSPSVALHGQLGQEPLARLMRRSAVCVLPSFYEGLPLVLVEALACGCRLVATDLPGIRSALAPRLGSFLRTVAPPRLTGPDQPVPADLPAFVDRLAEALEASLGEPPPALDAAVLQRALEPFRWEAVYNRVEALWRELIPSSSGAPGPGSTAPPPPPSGPPGS